jgi:hypothetical protein
VRETVSAGEVLTASPVAVEVTVIAVALAASPFSLAVPLLLARWWLVCVSLTASLCSFAGLLAAAPFLVNRVWFGRFWSFLMHLNHRVLWPRSWRSYQVSGTCVLEAPVEMIVLVPAGFWKVVKTPSARTQNAPVGGDDMVVLVASLSD